MRIIPRDFCFSRLKKGRIVVEKKKLLLIIQLREK